MITRLTKLWISTALLMALVACGTTPPAQHYRLSARESLPESTTGPALGVGPVSIPPYLDRNGVVRSDGANGLQIANNERWAEPLDEGITRVVSLNLAGLMQTQNIQLFPWHPRRQPEFGIKIRVLAMDADAKQVSLVAEWLLYRVDNGEALTRRLQEYNQPLSTPENSAAVIAASYSDLLYRLSRDIAAAVEEVSAQRQG